MEFKVLKSNKRVVNKLAKELEIEIEWTGQRNGIDLGNVTHYKGFSELNKFIERLEATLLSDPDMFLNLVELKAAVKRDRQAFNERYGNTIDRLKPKINARVTGIECSDVSSIVGITLTTDRPADIKAGDLIVKK